MPWIKKNGAKYHTQDKDYYCGGACAMTLLAEIGVPHASLDQQVLYDSNHAHNAKSGWYSDPEGLRFTLVDRKPASFAGTFAVDRQSSEPEASRKLVHTLRKFGVSPIALVYGDPHSCEFSHWVVVCGVQTDVDPAIEPYAIQGFCIHNPITACHGPHDADDDCGSGGSYGTESQWMNYLTWQQGFLTGCNYDSADGSRQYICVCVPDEPTIAIPRPVEPVHYFDNENIPDASAVLDALKKELLRYSLAETKPTANAASGKFTTPLLVRRLDDEANAYYLVPSMVQDSVIGYAQIDARYGSLDSLFTLKRGVKPYETDPEKIAAALEGTNIDLPVENVPYRLERGKFKVDANPVWRPCRESFSSHLPFWRIVAQGHTLYQRVDGPIFAELTTRGRGV